MSTSVRTTLFCLRCDKETAHSVIYSGKHIHRIVCGECGTRVAISREKIAGTHASSVLERVLTKPVRMRAEMKKDFPAFMAFLPLRLLTKPARIARELIGVFRR